jgi:hypothetical protein
VDLSEFQQEVTPWHVCAVELARRELSKEQADKLAAAFNTAVITSSNIAKVLGGWVGREIAVATVRRHRRGECKCQG